MLKTGPWNLTDLKYIPKNGYNVFSCFHCGGGSTMGYKLAGFNVLGGVEIDPEMMNVYKANHHPKYSYLMGVQDFKNIPNEKLPQELFELDILDGSPPCSSFSSAGDREKKWGIEKKFREGQAKQVLDDLFFHYIDIVNKLQPKIVVAENVKGLIQGNARGYVKEIFSAFDKAGYQCQLFLLNAAFMGVPQRRERTFFIARRKDLNISKLKLEFNEVVIPFKNIKLNVNNYKKITDLEYELWKQRKISDKSLGCINQRINNKIAHFSTRLIKDEQVLYTITASDNTILYSNPRHLLDLEIIRGQTFPDDYNFLSSKTKYLCGMSVPPFMTQRIALQIYKQWLEIK